MTSDRLEGAELDESLAVLASGNFTSIDRETAYAQALNVVRKYYRIRWNSVSREDQEDLALEVVVRVLGKIERGDQQIAHRGYLLTSARNAITDSWRRRPVASVALDDLAQVQVSGDDEVAAAFDRLATARLVQQALDVTYQAGDRVAFSAVATALNETATTGSRPSNRSIADRIGVSHTAVNKALVRFEGTLKRLRGDAFED